MPQPITVRTGIDAWIDEDRPSASNGGDPRLRLRAGVGSRRAFLWLDREAEDGSTVHEDVLYLTQVGDAFGEVSIHVAPLQSRFSERVTAITAPEARAGDAAVLTKQDPRGGTVWAFDVAAHLQAAVVSGEWYGWRITTDSTSGVVLRGLESEVGRPRHVISYSDAPAQPDDLTPSTGVVSVAQPVLSFSYTDPDSAIEAARIQISAPGNGFDAALIDSDWVSTADPEISLSQIGYSLDDGAELRWRVRVRDLAGLASEWSEPARLARRARQDLQILSPSEAEEVGEYSPSIIWSGGATQTHWRVRILREGRGEVYTSRWQRGAETSHTIPRGVLRDDRRYVAEVVTRDEEDREATAGDPAHARATRPFVVRADPDIEPVATIEAEAQILGPGIAVTWTRSDAPDSWTIKRDGAIIESGIFPEDVIRPDGSYRWVDLTARGDTEHLYRVLPVVGRRVSEDGNRGAAAIAQGGCWLIDEDSRRWALLRDADVEGMTAAEQSETVTPLGARRVARRIFGVRGLEGQITAVISETETGIRGPSLVECREVLRSMRERPAARFRLRVNHVSIPVYLGDLTVSPHNDSRAVYLRDRVRFSFWQAGDLDLDLDL